jgi:hypothetical protein
MKWLSVPLIVASLILATAAHAAPAQAYTVKDAPHLRALRIEAPNDRFTLCVVLPSVAGDCDGLNTAQLAEGLRKATAGDVSRLAYGILRSESSSVFVDVTVMPYDAANTSSEGVEAFMRGMSAREKESGHKYVKAPFRTQVRGHEAVWAEMDLAVSGIVLRTTSVSLFARDRIHQFSVYTPVEQAQDAREVVEHMIASLDYDPGDLGLFDKPHSYALGYHTAKMVMSLWPVLIGLGVGLFFLIRSRRRARGKLGGTGA